MASIKKVKGIVYMEEQFDTSKLFIIDKPKQNEENYIRPQQSANVLFNFMRELDYLKLILTNKAIIPRYYEETVEYLELSNLKRFAFPMTCFCDINLQKLIPHVKFYGYYGIGLDKKWGIRKGVQPIQYINKSSKLKEDFSHVFSIAIDKISEENIELREFSNYLLTNLLFLKPLHGEMFRDKSYVQRNFHDEREWRFVPDMNRCSDLPLTVPQNQLNPKAYSSYSDGIKKYPELWLNFEYDVIKYLIVHDSHDRRELIKFITENNKIDEIEKSILISKILVFDEIEEDW